MRFRRVLRDGALQHESERDGTWQPDPDAASLVPSAFAPAHEASVAAEHVGEGDATLPFQPLSFRDFLLFEQHNIDASRGLVKRFHPEQYRATAAVEAITRRPFPKFRPHRLFHQQPIYYMSNHVTVVPSGVAVPVPPYSRALDFELELGFVLGRTLRDATPDEAVDAIAAFVVLNDFSARDVQRAEMASGFGPQKSKHFATSISTVAVTPDEVLPRIDELTGSVSINSEQVSTVSSAGMRWSLGEVLAHASAGETLRPGELFATGTLPGGSGMELGHWLQPGDALALTIDGIGTIEHTIG